MSSYVTARNGIACILFAAGFLGTTSALLACAQAPPKGAYASVATEEAAIAWDRFTNTERFIRRVSFQSDAKDFGFLVPTPEPPKLDEGDNALFDELDWTYRPKRIEKPIHGFVFRSVLDVFSKVQSKSLMSVVPEGRGVEVVSTQQVAGFDATVLRANDLPGLGAWLSGHGYETRPALMEWLRLYVARGWTITAFKIAKHDPGVARISSATVRMTFHADQPFYPYSEPADQRAPGAYSPARLLRVFLLSDARMDALMYSQAARWPGKTAWASEIPQNPTRGPSASQIDEATGADATTPPVQATSADATVTPAKLWLTAFEDRSSPRPGVADLYFQPSESQTPVEPPPVEIPIDERVRIPIELLVIPALAVMGFFWRRRAHGSAA